MAESSTPRLKVLHSICQQIWKTQQCPQDWKRSVFIPIPKKGNPCPPVQGWTGRGGAMPGVIRGSQGNFQMSVHLERGYPLRPFICLGFEDHLRAGKKVEVGMAGRGRDRKLRLHPKQAGVPARRETAPQANSGSVYLQEKGRMAGYVLLSNSG